MKQGNGPVYSWIQRFLVRIHQETSLADVFQACRHVQMTRGAIELGCHELPREKERGYFHENKREIKGIWPGAGIQN